MIREKREIQTLLTGKIILCHKSMNLLWVFLLALIFLTTNLTATLFNPARPFPFFLSLALSTFKPSRRIWRPSFQLSLASLLHNRSSGSGSLSLPCYNLLINPPTRAWPPFYTWPNSAFVFYFYYYYNFLTFLFLIYIKKSQIINYLVINKVQSEIYFINNIENLLRRLKKSYNNFLPYLYI